MSFFMGQKVVDRHRQTHEPARSDPSSCRHPWGWDGTVFYDIDDPEDDVAKKNPQPASKRAPEHQRAVEERRRSSAAAAHDPRPNRLRTRTEGRRRAIDEHSS